MDLRATPNLVHLSESGRRSVQLAAGKGFRIVAVSGDVWVTQAGFIEDYILRPGDGLTLESPGPAIVTSFGPADVEVIAPAAVGFEASPALSATVIERAQQEARRLRAQAMQEAFSAAAAWLGSLGRRVASALTSTGAARASRQHC